MEASLSYRRVAGGHAPHATAYEGHMDDDRFCADMGSSGSAGDDAGDADQHVCEASSGLSKEGSGGVR